MLKFVLAVLLFAAVLVAGAPTLAWLIDASLLKATMFTMLSLWVAVVAASIAAVLFHSQRDDTFAGFCFVAACMVSLGALAAFALNLQS